MSKVWRYGDHVDTDVIIPARYLNITDLMNLPNMQWKILKKTLLLILRLT